MAYSFVPLQIILMTTCASVLIEVVSYFLVYRTSTYRRLVDEIGRSGKKVEQLKSTGNSSKQAKKTQKRFDGSLKMNIRDFVMVRFKSMSAMFLLLIGMFALISRLYAGVAIGKLPFMPVSFLTKITHRGVDGENMAEYGAAFVYMLCSVGLRQNIQKFIGLGPSRSLQKHLAMEDFAAKFFKVS